MAVLVAFFSLAHGQEMNSLEREREQQTGTAITILFDNSGSMKGEKIQQAKSAFRSWLQTVPAEYKYSLITFEDNGRLVVPLGENTRDTIAKRVADLKANTSTPICGALRIAREQIEKRRRDVTPYERHVVLIFTDGQETADRRGADGVRADIEALRKLTVEVVGVGFHGEGDYMNGVATRFALANNEQELKQGLAKVDAEIGGVDDLVVTPADLAALKHFNAPAVQPISEIATVPAVEPGAASEPPQAAPSSRPKRGINLGWIVTIFIIWVALRTIFGSKKARR
jgi:Ca-activated chloride channel family protein